MPMKTKSMKFMVRLDWGKDWGEGRENRVEYSKVDLIQN